jgi:hypothetical protein
MSIRDRKWKFERRKSIFILETEINFGIFLKMKKLFNFIIINLFLVHNFIIINLLSIWPKRNLKKHKTNIYYLYI